MESSVSAQFSVTVQVELDARQEPLGKLTAAITEAGGGLQSVDMVPGAGGEGKRVREITIDARDQDHWEHILRAIGGTRGAKVAPKYHTARFMLVPTLRAELEVRTPADRGPGRAWEWGPTVPVATPEPPTKPTRVASSWAIT